MVVNQKHVAKQEQRIGQVEGVDFGRHLDGVAKAAELKTQKTDAARRERNVLPRILVLPSKVHQHVEHVPVPSFDLVLLAALGQKHVNAFLADPKRLLNQKK